MLDRVIDDGEQPRCKRCGVVMRDIEGGWQCPSCGEVLAPVMKITMPPKFRGPAIHDGPRYDPGDDE
jgi:tRNA(Ile2) C34 agmatinyltransferase TiaS